MTIQELVSEIADKHRESGITVNPPCSIEDILSFERRIGFELPDDFIEFYLLCNGFSCVEDLFNMTPLEEVLKYDTDHGKYWFHFAEYMIASDMWTLRKTPSGYFEIFNRGEKEIILTTSLADFLSRFLEGNVFDEGGLYAWHKEFS